MSCEVARMNLELSTVLKSIDSWIDPAVVSCAAVVVRHRGEQIGSWFAGALDDGMPVRDNTLFALASVTKPVLAAAVLALVDDGEIALDEPIARFVPEFATPHPDGVPEREAGRRLVTVRQVLGHTSGLPEDLPPGTIPLRTLPTLDDITDAMIRQPLQFDPGSALRYSNTGYGVLGRVLQRVTGADMWDVARTRVLDPLGLGEVIARPGSLESDRIATVLDVREKGTQHEPYQSPYWRDLAVPWAGLYGTAEAMARYAESFLPGRESGLSQAAKRAMTTDQAMGVSGGLQMLRLTWHPAFWGLGWEIKGTKRGHWTGDYTSAHTWCHWGAAGTLLWTDPIRELTVAAFGNRATYNGWPFMPVARWARLSNAIIAAVER